MPISRGYSREEWAAMLAPLVDGITDERLMPTGADLAERFDVGPGAGNGARRMLRDMVRERLSGHRARPVEAPRGPAPSLPEIERWDAPKPAPMPPFAVSALQDDGDTDEAFIARRVDAFRRAGARATQAGPRVFAFAAREPIGIVHVGDPHVDDDGCDWPELLRVVRTVGSTPGMYAGNVGDVTNNWTGRLARLWAHQSTTNDDAIRAARWLFRSISWLYLVEGNHDQWNDAVLASAIGSDAVRHRVRHEARIEVTFPSAPPVRFIARHSFKGSSIWNPGHGPKRAAVFDPWGDVYVQGHHHDWHTMSEERPDGRPMWTIKARGFKRFDEYAAGLQFHDHLYGHAPTTIIDPWAPPASRVRVELDVEEAAAILTWLRARRAA